MKKEELGSQPTLSEFFWKGRLRLRLRIKKERAMKIDVKKKLFLLEAPTIAIIIQISKISRLATNYLITGFYLKFWDGHDNTYRVFEYFWTNSDV